MRKKLLSLSFFIPTTLMVGSVYAAQLEEVLVTAQKKVESVQDIPVSIGVVSGDDLAKFSITSTSDLDDATPGLVIQEAPGNLSTITLRGVGTAPGNESFDQSVSLFVDGVWAGRQREFSSALFDIQRVEVIKGTQNSLLGKNTSLGAISLITNEPGDEFAGYINSEYEFEYDSKLVSAAVDLPVADNLKTRIAINYKDKIGDVENIYTGNDVPSTEQFAARFKAAFDISHFGNAIFTYQKDSLDILGDNFQVAFDNSHQIRDQAPGTPIGADDAIKSSFTRFGEDGDSFDTQDSQRANFTANFDIGEYQLTTVTGYSRYTNERRIDADFTYKEFLYQETESDFEQFSQELRITSPEYLYFDYTAGAFFLKNQFSKKIPTYGLVDPIRDALPPLLNSGANFLPARLGGDIDYALLASIIGQDILPVLPQALIDYVNGDGLGALNFDQLLVKLEPVWKGTALNNSDLALFGLNGAFESTFDQSTYVHSYFGQGTFYIAENWNFVAGMRYTNEKKEAIIERVELQPGLIHQLSFPLYDRERLTLEEKSLDGSVNLQYFFGDENMAYVTWGQGTKSGGFADQATLREDVPYDKEVATTIEIGTKLTFFDGAARLNMAAFNTDIEDYQTVVFVGLGFETSNLQAVSRGFEFDGQMALSENFFLAAGATFADAKDKDTDLALPLSPKVTANLGFHYERPLFQFDFSADFGLNYRSKMYHNLIEAQPQSDAVTRYDGRVAIADPEGTWELALVGKNLTDESNIAISGDMPGIADRSAAVAATEQRRTVTLQVNYNF